MSQYLSTGKSSEFFFSSRSTLASNVGAPGQPWPATPALPVNPRQQLRRSRSTLAGNSGAPGEPSPAALRVRGWTLRVFSSLAAPRHLLGSHEQTSTYPVAPSDVLYPLIGQFSTRSACILPFFPVTPPILVEELSTLPPSKSVVRRNLHVTCPISPKCQFHLLRLRWSPLLAKCADRTILCLPAWPHRASLTGTHLRHHALSAMF